MKEIPFSPRIFLGIAIANWICVGILLVGCGVLVRGDPGGGFAAALVLATIIFSQIGSLAGQQYRAMRALDEKLKNLQEAFARRQELPAK